jgi:aerobic carbon-monoxide dehydrogenase large subunit
VIEAPGRIALFTGVSTAGQGHETVLAQILADALGVPLAGITVFHGSTSYVERGYGTYASRAIVMGGSAVTVAATNLVRQVLAFAAGRLDLKPDDLVYRDGLVFRRGGNEPVLTLDALADEAVAGSTAAAEALHAAGTFENSKLTYSYGTHVAHVAVDPETAQVEVIRFIAVEDIGRAVNPLLVHGQAIGSAVQGLGGAFLDQLVYDAAGQLLTGSFADYLLPTSTDFPNIEAITLEDAPSTLNPLGVKGAGEGGIVASGAAVANAVADALRPLGVTICELPLSLDNLARWLREARSQQKESRDGD